MEAWSVKKGLTRDVKSRIVCEEKEVFFYARNVSRVHLEEV